MKMTIESNDLSAALNVLNRVVNRKSAIASLQNLRVQLESGVVTLTARDGSDMEMKATIVVVDAEDGATTDFLVDAAQLTNALRGLGEQDITLEYDGENITIDYIGGSLSFATSNGEGWPIQLPFTAGVEDSTRGQVLLSGITRVQYAASNDQTRMIMCGVCVSRKGEMRYFTASDGRVLTRTSAQADSECDNNYDMVFPEKLCNVLRASMKSGNQVKMQRSDDESYVRLKYGDYSLTAKLIDGKVPNYVAVIPQDSPYHYTLDKATLAACIRRVSLFAPNNSQLLRLEFSKGRLKVIAKDEELFARTRTETLSIKDAWAVGDKELPETFAIGVSAEHFMAVLDNFGAAVVELQTERQDRPIVFKGDDDVTILMPMRIEDEESKAEAAA